MSPDPEVGGAACPLPPAPLALGGRGERREALRAFRGTGGFALLSAIAILVLLSTLAGYLARIGALSQIGAALDIQGSRAYHAARAGVEWGLYQVLDPSNATVVAPGSGTWPNLPTCPAATTLTLEGFSVAVTCTAYGPYYESGNSHTSQLYTITATATSGTVGNGGYAERQLSATVSKCRATDGSAPSYACP
ncbi:MAG: hypothetical protein PHU46_03405 [Rhodocyclaceae bacterium]|nr:hypothetical protein [Rhodocyclaceae bacterium]